MAASSTGKGWQLVERYLQLANERIASARSADDFSTVGRTCSDVLLLLLQAIYVLDRDHFAPPSPLRISEPLTGLLETYISTRLTDPSREAALGSLRLAATTLQNSGTTDADSAEMCLTATAALVRYLSISSGRRPSRDTVAALCERFLADNPKLGLSRRYTIQRLTRSPIGKRIASSLTVEDVIDHCRLRRGEGTGAATVTQDVSYLRGVIATARDHWNLDVSTDPIDHAKRQLSKLGVISKSTPRNRRPTRDELQNLVDFFDEKSQHKNSKIPMRDIVEFALWSARRISEICSLRWQDLDEKNRTCIVRVTDARNRTRQHSFPLLGKAWDIVQRQPRTSDRIFPYVAKSAGASYTLAKKKLGIPNLRFQDLRREAAIRLHEAGHSVEQIAKVTGRIDLNTLQRDISSAAASPAASPQASGPAPSLGAAGK